MKIRRWLGALFGTAESDGLGSIRFRGAMIGVVAAMIMPVVATAAALSRMQWTLLTPALVRQRVIQQIGWPVTDFQGMKDALLAAAYLPWGLSLIVFPLLCAALVALFALWPATGAAAAHLIAAVVRARRVRRGCCAACTYPLAGQPRCAECGLLRCSLATRPARWRVQLACLPLVVIAAVNLVPLALYLAVPRATVLVSTVDHVHGGAAAGPDWFSFERAAFGWRGLGRSVSRHPSLCRVMWAAPPDGPMATEVLVRFGWPAPWCILGSARLPAGLLSFSSADPGWARLLEEIDAVRAGGPFHRAGAADGAHAVPGTPEPSPSRFFRRRVAAALLDQGQYGLRTHWSALAGNLFFGAMLSAIALAAVVRAPVPRATE